MLATLDLIPTTYVCLEILPYCENEAGVAYREWFLANFSSVKQKIYFAVVGSSSQVALYIRVPATMQEYVMNTFYANFTTSELKPTTQVIIHGRGKYLNFSDGVEFYDTKSFWGAWSYIDPFREVLSWFQWMWTEHKVSLFFESSFDDSIGFWEKCKKFVKNLFNPTEKHEKEGEDLKDQQQAAEVKQVGRDVTFAVSCRVSWTKDARVIGQLQNDMTHLFDKFLHQWSVKLSLKKKSVRANRNAFVNMFHIPTKEYTNNALKYITYRKLAAPMHLPLPTEADITILGKTDRRGAEKGFGIRAEDKFRHLYIVGKTWMGKSTLISNLVRSDMHAGSGIAVLDPHGDLIEDCLAHIPSSRINDVVLFDVSDTNFPVWFNVMEIEHEDQKNLVASGVVSIFKKLFWHSRWPRLEYILRNVMLSVLEYPNATLMHVARILTDKNFKEEVLSNVTDPIVLKFWRDEYDKRSEKQVTESVSPITNKIGQFLSSSIVRNIFAQPKSKINIRKIMDEGKILLINLSKGKIGEDNAAMIGSFLVTKLQIDAMSRADLPYDQRKDFFCYIDEFQNFATDSFSSILSEARKYRLSLIVANQFTAQIEENVRNAIFGNVGTIVSFGLGYDDAMVMSSQFKEMITANDLLSLPKFKAYTRLMINGVTSDPFSIGTFPLPKPETSEEIKAKIKQQSRQRYAVEKGHLEELLKAWAWKTFSKAEKVMEKAAAEAKTQAVTTGVSALTIDKIQLGTRYEWYVKLKYNYGLFVTVQWVEWLLHKTQIDVPVNLDGRKDLYNIGDKIRVKATEFKDVEGIKRVVRGQK
jgi:hypothetical protein